MSVLEWDFWIVLSELNTHLDVDNQLPGEFLIFVQRMNVKLYL